jgi:hypothetical protein
MVPTHVVPLAELPLLPNGKVDRGALPIPAVDSAPEPPSPGPELLLHDAWCEVLGLSRVGSWTRSSPSAGTRCSASGCGTSSSDTG